tara:strand:+ start:4042 stop:4785 length:744 start_codon:yes stop_codon:yes gene_type:complete
MKRWKCVCAYDGTSFTGWQSQPSHDSVQDIIEAALARILKADVRIHGSGRTDAGVHAMAQVFHFDSDWKHGGRKLTAALGAQLPLSIRIQSTCLVDKEFHARYSALAKRYHYRIFLGQADPFETRYCLSIPYQLNVQVMRSAGDFLLGGHDFSAFSAENGADPDKGHPVKDFRAFQLSGRGKRLRLTFEASGFLYKMVRSLTGALLRVGQGKLSPEEFRSILNSRTRTKDVVTAGPRGLFLEKVYYN